MTAPYSGGMYHPGVIQQPGAGDALAGGLSTVLGALLQKKQLDQHYQEFQANLAEKQAQTEQAMALAKNTGAETDIHKQKLKEMQTAAETADEEKHNRTASLGWLMSNSDVASDPVAFGQRWQQGVQNKTITPGMVPFLLEARDKSLGFAKDLATTQGKQNENVTSAANAAVAPQMAGANLADKQADVLLKRAQASKATKDAQGGDLKPLPQKTRETIVNQRDMLTQIDQAITMLKANPDAIGPVKGTIPPHLLDVFDSKPENVATRAAIQNVRADKLNELYKSRLTKTEIEQGAQIFADVRTPPKVAITKLQQLRTRVSAMNKQYEKSLSGQGYKPFAADDAAEAGAPTDISTQPPPDFQSQFNALRAKGMSPTDAYKALRGGQ